MQSIMVDQRLSAGMSYEKIRIKNIEYIIALKPNYECVWKKINKNGTHARVNNLILSKII